MRKHRKLVILLSFTVVVGAALALLRPAESEPTYRGKSVSGWLNAWYESDLTNGNGQRELAISAIKSMGTNALPALLRRMQYEVPSWCGAVGRLPAGIAFRILGSPPVRATVVRSSELKERARLTLQELGTNAVSAIPELTRIMADRKCPQSAPAAALILSHMGLHGFHRLVAALDDTNHPFRESIVLAIGTGSAQLVGTNTCLPRINAALEDKDPIVRITATNMLTYITKSPNSD